MYCQMCLQQALEGESFCTYCGSPVQAPMGSIQKRVEVDRAGNVTRILYYDLWDGRLGVAWGGEGIAVYEYEYDSAGNRIRERLCGANGRLKENSDGIAIYEWGYDGSGNLVQARYFDKGRFPKNYCGAAVLEWQYDSAGNVVLERRYAAMENKRVCGIGFSEYKYDGKGKLVQENAYDEKGCPVQKTVGLAGHSGALHHVQAKEGCEHEPRYEGYPSKEFSVDFNKDLFRNVNLYFSSEDPWEGLTPQVECESGCNTARVKFYDGNGNLAEDLFGVAIYEWIYICPVPFLGYRRRMKCYKKNGALNVGQTIKLRMITDVFAEGFFKLIKLKRALCSRKAL